jgi:HAD superfamily hydrolase (TIGR01549 family)
MIKTVFFDLDDTLYDHSGTVDITLANLKDRLPSIRELQDDEIRNVYHDLLEKYHRLFIDGVLPFDEVHRQRWVAMLDHWQIRDVDAEELRIFWRQHYLANQQLVSGAVDLLTALRNLGLTIGIVTNNSVDEQVGKIRSLNIEHLIDHLVISKEVGFGKPDERIYSVALDRSGMKADEAVMVGDHWLNDILSPSRVGIRGVWLNRKRSAIPDPKLASEIFSLEPTEIVKEIIIGPKQF